MEDQVNKFAKRMRDQSQGAITSEANVTMNQKMANAAAKAVRKSTKAKKSHGSSVVAPKSSVDPVAGVAVSADDLPAPKQTRPKRSSSAIVNYNDSTDDHERLFYTVVLRFNLLRLFFDYRQNVQPTRSVATKSSVATKRIGRLSGTDVEVPVKRGRGRPRKQK